MSLQQVNLGTAPTGVGGDTPRSAFQKVNDALVETYTALGGSGNPLVIPAALPVTKGGTGGTTQAAARAGLGLGSSAVAPLVGTMAEGAIFEIGTNVNGAFVKHADGSLECRARLDPGLVQPNGTISANWNFPFPFADTPVISGIACTSGGYGYLMSMGGEAPATSTNFSLSFVNRFSESRYAIVYLIAKGRWK